MEQRDELERAGYSVIGPASALGGAMELAAGENPDAAILDVNLDGAKVFPLARRLRERGVPFLLLTGYDTVDLPADLRDVPIVHKPAPSGAVLQFLAGALCAKPDLVEDAAPEGRAASLTQ